MPDSAKTYDELLTELALVREKARQQKKLLLTSTDFFHRCSRSPFEAYVIDWIEGQVELVLGHDEGAIRASGCWLHFVHPDDVSRVGLRLLSIKPGDVGEQEFRFVRQDGGIRWVNERYRCEFDAVEKRFVLYGALKDVTAARQAEQALRESEKRFRIVADNTTHWEYWQAPDGSFSWVSPACERISGYAAREFMRSPRLGIRDIVHPDDAGLWEQHLRRVEKQQFGRCELEFRIIRKSGEPIWISHSCTGNFDETGAYLGRRGCNIDITDRKKDEALVRAMLTNLPLDFWARDLAGKVIMQSDISQAIWGDLAQESQSALVPADTLARWQANAAKAYSGQRVDAEAEYRLPDGGDVYYHEILAPIRSREEILGIMGVNVDLTDRRRMECDLRAAKEAAEAASRTKSEFLANMSHEVRTPLNGILGMLQLLGTTSLNEEQQEYLLGSIKSSQRLTQLLSDILDLSRIEAGKLPLHESSFDFSLLRQSVLDLFAQAASDKGLRLVFTVAGDMPQQLVGDETRLRQILFNLVGNAVKFTLQGQVTVEARPLPVASDDKVQVLFTVSDTGIGIPDDQLHDVFEPFSQIEGSYTRRFQGAGLGLSIVRKLVRLLGGELAVDSTEGGGTTMYCSIPLKRHVAAVDARTSAASRAGQPRALTILMAEDEAVSLMAGRRMLEKAGYQVVPAHDGQEALTLLAEQAIDLVLMDVQMPVLDGVTAVRRIRQGQAGPDKAGVPIIAVTAYAMPGDKERFLAAGINAYVTKPMGFMELQAAIDRVWGAVRPGLSPEPA